jgi:hypothetical protein
MIIKDEFIFSIKQLFTTVLEGKDAYYIAPYQRGYKWGKYVRIMLQDILNACNKDSDKDYFLNFISVKETEVDDKKYIELIDGQQRITTLILFWSLVNKHKDQIGITLSNNYDGINNDLTDKLIICRQRSEQIVSLLDLENQLADTQDNFYLRSAVSEMIEFLKELKLDNYNIQKYLVYFSNHVKIIINEEKEGISAAEIFGNLNSNKVDLTDTYLVKGLLLSLASRDTDSQEKRYREIMERRTVMGRLWDEIYYWIDSKPVKLFFFGGALSTDKSLHPLDILITMAAQELEIVIEIDKDVSYPIFNSLYKDVNKYDLATQFLDVLKAKFWFFKRMYESKNNTIYNLLGLVLYNLGDNLNKRVELLKEVFEKKNDSEILAYLKKKQLQNMQNIIVEDLHYKNKYENSIYIVLLSISAIDDNLGSYSKFNFYDYLNTKNGWSIEHIFPQNITISNQSKNYIDHWINTISNENNVRKEDIELFKSKANSIYELEGKQDSKSEITKLNEDITSIFDRIVVSLNIDTDSIGNLALLGIVDNIKLSNALFEEKKYRLLNYSSKGSFVPKHTFSVFNKSIINDNSLVFKQNNIWTNKEINEHKKWLTDKIELIKIELTN